MKSGTGPRVRDLGVARHKAKDIRPADMEIAGRALYMTVMRTEANQSGAHFTNGARGVGPSRPRQQANTTRRREL